MVEKTKDSDEKSKSYYFDNNLVEKLVSEYVKGGCTDVELRNKVMACADELIKQIIRAHNFVYIFPGRDESSATELYQVAWTQIEKTLYKFDPGPNAPKLFNLWCIDHNTQIFSEDGIKKIINVIDNKNSKTYGIGGITNIKGSIVKQEVDTFKIETALGYHIETSPEHYLYKLGDKGPSWVQNKDLNVGDLLGIQYNQNSFVNDNSINIKLESEGDWNPPKEFNEELAYFIGLYVSEGSHYKNTLTIYNIDTEVVNSLMNNKLGFVGFHKPKYQRVNIYNKRLIEFIKKIGFEGKNAHNKEIPQCLLKCSKNIIISLLRGMFDGDGHSSRHNGCIGYTSTSDVLIDQIKMMLLNFGIISKISCDNRKTRDGSKQVVLSAFDSLKFYNDIGFGIVRKQINVQNLENIRILRYGLLNKTKLLCDRYNISNRGSGLRSANKSKFGLHEILKVGAKLAEFDIPSDDPDLMFVVDRLAEFMGRHDNIIWLPIIKKEKSSCKVCEIEVDSENSSYIANGFISHNSQVAKTRILAFIKKEKRDKKNVVGYKDYLSRRQKTKAEFVTDFQTWIKEAKEICDYNDDFLVIIDAVEELWKNDERPYDGLISKLEKISSKSKSTINQFLKTIRMHKDEFTVDLTKIKTYREFDISDDDGYFYNDTEVN